MEITFTMNEIFRLDDYTFCGCAGCPQSGYWGQHCPTKKIAYAYCGDEHSSVNCSRGIKRCANCGQEGHCTFSRTCTAFKSFVLAQNKGVQKKHEIKGGRYAVNLTLPRASRSCC
ncbi:hypothetical protein ACOME3_006920 [Neoechinorhynchus agilis]